MPYRTTGASGSDAPSLLATVPLFSSLTPSESADIASRFQRVAFAREDVFFFEGSPPDWLYVVVDGFVKLVKHSDDGRDVILHVAAHGDLMGGVSAFGRRPHPFTAQAMTAGLALRVAGPEFAAIMKDHPPIASQTVASLIDELTEAHETAKSLATERVERRIARQLVKLAERMGRSGPRGVEIVVPLARQDVADIAGTTVESAIRVLSRWRQLGLVHTVSGRLIVSDLEALRSMAEEA